MCSKVQGPGFLRSHLFDTNAVQFGRIVHIKVGVKAHRDLGDCSVKWDILEIFSVSL